MREPFSKFKNGSRRVNDHRIIEAIQAKLTDSLVQSLMSHDNEIPTNGFEIERKKIKYDLATTTIWQSTHNRRMHINHRAWKTTSTFINRLNYFVSAFESQLILIN